MIFTKTEIKALELATSRILDSFTIREAARLMRKDLKIVHTSIQTLIQKEMLIKDKKEIRLNYKTNWTDLAYIENIRKEEFFKKNTIIKAHTGRFLNQAKNKMFILLVFGSYSSGTNTKKSDIDLLAILLQDDEQFERQLNAAFSTLKTHITTITTDSFKEMLNKRDEMNIINETMNKHILLYGAEQYYALLGERDVN